MNCPACNREIPDGRECPACGPSLNTIGQWVLLAGLLFASACAFDAGVKLKYQSSPAKSNPATALVQADPTNPSHAMRVAEDFSTSVPTPSTSVSISDGTNRTLTAEIARLQSEDTLIAEDIVDSAEQVEPGNPEFLFLALRVAYDESRFGDGKGSEERGMYGPMQLNKQFFPDAPTMTIEENIRAGVAYLHNRWLACGKDAKKTQRAYREGPGVCPARTINLSGVNQQQPFLEPIDPEAFKLK